jgi:L-alanine-DL-glutamate epimerase-like enolase superfamily enzyme
MKITRVTTTLFRSEPSMDLQCLVELSTDRGLTGLSIGAADIREPVEALVEASLTGEDPRSVVGLWRRLEQGLSDTTSSAIATLDVALWDLKAKANGEPLWKSLGARRPRVNAYASAAANFENDQDLCDWYGKMARDFGLCGGKLQVGRDAATDHKHLGLMKEALSNAGRQPELMICAGESWTVEQAIENISTLEREFDLIWVEHAVSDNDFPGLKQVSDGISAAVCSGGNFAAAENFRTYFQNHVADIIRLDIGTLGITASLQLADAAFGLELPVTLGVAPGNIHAQVAAAMPNVMSVEITDPLPDGVFSTDVRIEGGWAIAGDAPGNGLTIDREMLARSALGAGQ